MVHMIKRIALMAVALASASARDRDAAVLDALEQRAREALAAIHHAETRDEADRARPALRRKLEQSLGFRKLPWPPELRPRTVGALQRPGYRIEKIVYQTLPGVHVPAHVYVPEALTGRAPAIVFYNGHWWAEGKAKSDFQAFCINMAKLGFVVLNFDAFGQGERGVSDRDHRRTESLLAGISQQGYAEYETQCALEYLLARPDVDPDRIGITGASGGGYNTWMTVALDDRIKVAVPVVGTSEFYEQLSVCRRLDWYKAKEHCHFVAGLIRYANNHELFAMAAPRPVLIVAASEDESFPVAGVRKIAAYGKALYGSYGVPEKAGYFEDSTEGHGYQKRKREAAYGWFLRWLAGRGDGAPFPEPATETMPPASAELRCFPAGHNEPAGPGMHAAIRIPVQRNPRSAPGPAPGPATPAGTRVLIAVDDRGKQALDSDPAIRRAREEGWRVVGIDPRGIGETALTKPGWVFAVSLLLGENFVEQQGADLAAAIRNTGACGLYARGDNAALAAAYAVASRPASLRWYILRDGFTTFRHFIDRPESMRASYTLHKADPDDPGVYDREIPAFYFPFGALEHRDIPDLLNASPARGLVVDPIDGDWQPLTAERARPYVPERIGLVSGPDAGREIERFLKLVR